MFRPLKELYHFELTKSLSVSNMLIISFQDSFYEGKDLAEQSEILELPANANPEEYYYGEGSDFEQSQQQQS